VSLQNLQTVLQLNVKHTENLLLSSVMSPDS